MLSLIRLFLSFCRNLFELIERFFTDTKVELDREDLICETTPAIVLSSSADLFLFYKKSLVQCKELSNEQPMLSLANTFQNICANMRQKFFRIIYQSTRVQVLLLITNAYAKRTDEVLKHFLECLLRPVVDSEIGYLEGGRRGMVV